MTCKVNQINNINNRIVAKKLDAAGWPPNKEGRRSCFMNVGKHIYTVSKYGYFSQY
jgi:hypothetical protein